MQHHLDKIMPRDHSWHAAPGHPQHISFRATLGLLREHNHTRSLRLASSSARPTYRNKANDFNVCVARAAVLVMRAGGTCLTQTSVLVCLGS